MSNIRSLSKRLVDRVLVRYRGKQIPRVNVMRERRICSVAPVYVIPNPDDLVRMLRYHRPVSILHAARDQVTGCVIFIPTHPLPRRELIAHITAPVPGETGVRPAIPSLHWKMGHLVLHALLFW